eukprot:gnl/MRDRNA2_/MRDRNA2_91067_c0_seq1.p2 gnl/MRDRNA2_/MRDRNA2_91067_c0~~gnl/MRDRNA2_/MRDRNA2_91067_c0_seq1.p2  ORF type:complete len:102 (+),score=14.09 gnl/MRDRNA2_/MRDRNA2_91067_c0_seq1:156-461(+)
MQPRRKLQKLSNQQRRLAAATKHLDNDATHQTLVKESNSFVLLHLAFGSKDVPKTRVFEMFSFMEQNLVPYSLLRCRMLQFFFSPEAEPQRSLHGVLNATF